MKNSREAHAGVRSNFIFRDIVYIIILVLVSLFLGLLPNLSFGQDDIFQSAPPARTTFAPPAETPSPIYAPVTTTPASTASPAFSPAIPAPPPQPAFGEANPITAASVDPEPVPASAPVRPKQRNRQSQTQISSATPTLPVRSASADHPFARYLAAPSDPRSKITGKPMTVAELLEGTRNPAAWNQLLQSYWELTGLLVAYHVRCEAENLANTIRDTQQSQAVYLLNEQRRSAEWEFVKGQWALAECIKQVKGITIKETELPIPSDFPLFQRYETYSDKIARSERTKYLARMISIQESLIEAKNNSSAVTFEMTQSMQPQSSQHLVLLLNQRTAALLDLTKAVVEYNKMIAEYASETIPSNVSQYQLVGAVIRLQKKEAAMPIPISANPVEFASAPIQQIHYADTRTTPLALPPTPVMAEPAQQIANAYVNDSAGNNADGNADGDASSDPAGIMAPPKPATAAPATPTMPASESEETPEEPARLRSTSNEIPNFPSIQ